MAEFSLETHREAAACSIVTDSDQFGQGRIVAAKLGEGSFTSLSANILTPEEDLRFIVSAIGGKLPNNVYENYTREGDDGPPRFTHKQVHEISRQTWQKLGAENTTQGIDICFNEGIFRIAQSVTLPEHQQLDAQEMQILDCIRRGLIQSEIASELGIAKERVATHRKRVFDKLQVRTISAAVTMGHLALLYHSE